jgi:hypothetical protein
MSTSLFFVFFVFCCSLFDIFVIDSFVEPSQGETMVVKSLTVPPAKSTPTRASKRLKKMTTVSTTLEAHRPAASSDDVSIASCT